MIRTPDRDYLYRATLPRKAVEAALAKAVEAIDYDRFKPAVTDKRRSEYYFREWDAGYEMQEDFEPVASLV